MAYFVVSYELRHPSELARRRFCDELERLGGVEAVSGVYLIELDGDAKEVSDHLQKYVEDQDRLIVVEFTAAPFARVLIRGAFEWMSQRFELMKAG